MSRISDLEGSYERQEQALMKELQKTYQTESTLLFAQMKRRFEDETLKQNRVLKDELAVCFCLYYIRFRFVFISSQKLEAKWKKQIVQSVQQLSEKEKDAVIASFREEVWEPFVGLVFHL